MSLPTGTVTFLFTDLVGSTRLWEAHPDAMEPALARHDAIVRAAIEEQGGQIVKATGDGFHAAFVTAGSALHAAMRAQEALGAEHWGPTGPLTVRMGLHTGEARERDGDYYGTAVNRAARIMAVAHGGQALCSRTTIEVAGGSFPVRSLGAHRLADLATPEELFQVGDGAFPPLRSVDVVPTNLPTVRTELIGRSDELVALSELLERERLVTLTGVGGVGKTRLALAVAATLAAEFTDGCWLVELAPVANDDEVVTAVAGAMRAPATDLAGLAAYLADRRVLILLDNCEHVLDAAAELVDVVLETGAEVHVLTTSREPLGLDGEHVRRVPSLELPGTEAALEQVRSAAAARLFAARAAAVSGGFAIDAENAPAVADVCRQLDGIPLAIELAASRVRAMPVDEIARRLDERFRLLAGGSRRAQERHRTLAATVAWSHDLCTPDEQVVFRRLSVFPASFDLGAAEAVAGDDVGDVVECVLHLVDRSLVDYEPTTARYRLLETLRQYGADRLAEAGETAVIGQRHARWFIDLAQHLAPGLLDARHPATSEALRGELDNLRATADWCITVERWDSLADVCLALRTFLEQDAPVDGAGWLRLVVDHASSLDPTTVAEAFGHLAWLEAVDLGDFAGSTATGERGVAFAREEGLPESPLAWSALAIVALMSGRPAESVVAGQRALEAAETRADEEAAVVALAIQISPLAQIGEHERSASTAREALRRAEQTGSPALIAAAIVSWSDGYLSQSTAPDFATSFEVLTRHAVGLRSGTVNDMWLDTAWGWTLTGLGHPGAVDFLAPAARHADRLGVAQALDRALTLIAISAARSGSVDQARALAGYAETALRPYRADRPGDEWIHSRLVQALGDPAEWSSDPRPGRREIMSMVDDLEAVLTADGIEETPAA